MTSIAELMERLVGLDIRLTLDGDRLTLNAPKGAVTAELRDELGLRKDELKAFLKTKGNLTAAPIQQETALALARVSRTAQMPVSHTQKRLWFIKQMDPNTYAYNIPAAVRIKGALNVAALERTLADLVNRHESLRTRFFSVDGAPCCAVETDARITLEHSDVTTLAEPLREAAALREVQAIAQRPFDLSRPPLLHTLLVRMASDLHIFAFVLDHIVADGLSLGIFLADFQALYTRNATGSGQPLPDLPVQYIDYAEWERRWFSQGVLKEHRDFWNRQLAGVPSLLQLPTDRPRPPIQTTHGARTSVRMPATLSNQLKALGRQENATFFIVLLSAFQTLLYRHSGETDIVVGSAVANRNRTEVDRVIGFFANNIVLRSDLSGNPTVRSVIAQVRDVALSAYAHQAMPFDTLVDSLGTRRELDHSPLFQVMFVLQNFSQMEFDLPEMACDFMEPSLTVARFDLAVDVLEEPQGLRVYFEYNTDLFDAATIDRMMEHYRHLLEGFVSHPEACIDDLPMLSEAERRQLVAYGNGMQSAYPAHQTVHELFEAQVARTPEAVALRFEETELSYRELNARANQLAHHLRTRGVGRESLVGVWMERSLDMVVALLGVLKAGGAYVPLDPAFPKDRLDYMMADAALTVVVTQSHLADSLGTGGPKSVCLDSGAAVISQLPTDNPASLADGSNLAYVIYTSGSTGRPKGVQLEHRSVVNFLLSMHREPGITAQDCCVAVTTLSFDIAGLEIYGPLTVGGAVVLASRATALDGARLSALLDRNEATLLQATPATWRLLLESGWRGRHGLKMLCGGEALPRYLAEQLLGLGDELWNLYGPTETTIWSTLCRVTETERAIPIGRPIGNTQVYVLEPSGLPAPIGVSGELCIGGDGLARGYRNRDDLTAEKFVTLDVPGIGATRVYRTGDVVRFRADGQLEFVGRRDHQVKVRGFRIEIGEIEAVLASHPGVDECVVQVREDTPGDQRLVSYVIPTPSVVFDVDAARATLRAKLPDYMIPNAFVTLDALPLTPNGKVDRKVLPAPQTLVANATDAVAAEALMTPVQRRIARLWCELLKLDHVGLHTNFFDLGGHSLLLARLQATLLREFGRELTLVELFQRTTVAAQAEQFSVSPVVNVALERAQARAEKLSQG
ncbi:MAG: amino acid adenylation domain-containing protein [Gammaproteobacteria bacterium]|nr:amino acid adenylation domain-containing protein [Gammaproteobacteria bacterium]